MLTGLTTRPRGVFFGRDQPGGTGRWPRPTNGHAIEEDDSGRQRRREQDEVPAPVPLPDPPGPNEGGEVPEPVRDDDDGEPLDEPNDESPRIGPGRGPGAPIRHPDVGTPAYA